MIGEESLGREGERQALVELAVQAADRVICLGGDGAVETLRYLTAEVARKFAEKSSIMALTEIYKQELAKELNLQRQGWLENSNECG